MHHVSHSSGDLAQMVRQVLVGPQAPRSPALVLISAGLVVRMPGLLFMKSKGSSLEGIGLLSYRC